MCDQATPRKDGHERSLSVQVMFQYDNRQNYPFEFHEYQPPKNYEQPQQKPKMVQPPTKKGFYMDYELKVAEGIPSPQKYQHMRVWSAVSNKSPKVDRTLKKYTYLDLLESEEKLRKKPAPGDYSLFPSQKQIAETQVKLDNRCRKRRISDKRYFYEDFEHLSSKNPGPGNYNPRPITRKIKPEKKDYKFWVDKHKSQSKSLIEKCKKIPDCGSYTPIPIDVSTFDRMCKTTRAKQKGKTTAKPWGTCERFSYSRPKTARSGTKEKRPEPGTYNMILDWPGKPHPRIKKKEHPNDWINKLSKSTASVYH